MPYFGLELYEKLVRREKWMKKLAERGDNYKVYDISTTTRMYNIQHYTLHRCRHQDAGTWAMREVSSTRQQPARKTRYQWWKYTSRRRASLAISSPGAQL